MILEGDRTYSWGEGNINPPTEKQMRIIEIIEEQLGIPFLGSTSREAYVFIGENKGDITL